MAIYLFYFALCLKKYTESGMESALRDDSGDGRKVVLSDADKAYVLNGFVNIGSVKKRKDKILV